MRKQSNLQYSSRERSTETWQGTRKATVEGGRGRERQKRKVFSLKQCGGEAWNAIVALTDLCLSVASFRHTSVFQQNNVFPIFLKQQIPRTCQFLQNFQGLEAFPPSPKSTTLQGLHGKSGTERRQCYLAAEPRGGRPRWSHCMGLGTRHLHSRAGRSQAGAGHMEAPLESAGLHSSSVHT